MADRAAPNRGKPGPKPSLTPELKARVVESFASGASTAVAAATAGVSSDTIEREQRRDPAFAEAIRKARWEYDTQHVESFLRDVACGRVDAGRANVTAAIFWLKNRQALHWRDRQDIEHSGGVQINVSTGVTRPPSDEPGR